MILRNVTPLNKTVGPQAGSRVKNNNSSLEKITFNLKLSLNNNSPELEGIYSINNMEKTESEKREEAVLRSQVINTPLLQRNYTEDKRDTVYDKNDQVYASSPAAVEHLEPETSKRVLATPSKQKDVNQSKGQDSQIRQW